MDIRKIEFLKSLLAKNNSKFFGVEFIKKNGELRKLSGNIRYVEQHNGENPAAHLQQYVTVVLPKKDVNGNAQFRNVNLNAVKQINISGKQYTFE